MKNDRVLTTFTRAGFVNLDVADFAVIIKIVQFLITNRQKLAPVRVGVELALTLRQLYPKEWEAEKLLTLLVNRQAMDGILAGESYATLSRRWSTSLRIFAQRRKPHLLYP